MILHTIFQTLMWCSFQFKRIKVHWSLIILDVRALESWQKLLTQNWLAIRSMDRFEFHLAPSTMMTIRKLIYKYGLRRKRYFIGNSSTRNALWLEKVISSGSIGGGLASRNSLNDHGNLFEDSKSMKTISKPTVLLLRLKTLENAYRDVRIAFVFWDSALSSGIIRTLITIR